jgi:nucleotide-binding universal stress UspA family protein
MKALVAYDGSLNSRTALKYGIQKVKEQGGEVLVLHVFNRSIFVDYDAGPGAERMARIESARFVEDAREILEGSGDIKSHIVVEEGDPAEEIVRLAGAENADIIYSPPRYKSIVKNAPCPVSIIPGNILVPLDNTDVSQVTLDSIHEEARATGSTVILLGIVPVHIYSAGEKAQLEKIKRQTSVMVKQVREKLNERQVEAKEVMCSGYPDEEILKVADGYPVSMIIMPAGGSEPSELTKAATILADRESGVTNKPLVLVHTA